MDPIPISPLYARTLGNPNQVQVVFSAAVLPASGTNAGNYSVSPAAAVTRAAMGADAYTVVLTTATLADDVLHTLTVNNVQDLAVPTNTVPANSRVPILKAQGVVTRKVFTGIGGNWLDSLTNNAKFPDAPDAVGWLGSGEAPANQGDYYGNQLAGWVCPPVTGDYQFYIASDNQGVLYLGTNSTPAGKVVLATVPDATGSRQWNLYASQRSGYVYLEAGRRYYFESLMAESTGNDCLALAWRMRGMPAPADGDAPIPGAFLSSMTPSAPTGLSVQPQDASVGEGQPAGFSAAPAGTPPYTYQWLRNGLVIPGATNSSYTLGAASAADQGAGFSVVVGNAFSSATSRVATLTVQPDKTPPVLLGVSGTASMDEVRLAFSERLDRGSAETAANYRPGGGLVVLSSVLLADGTNVVLTTARQSSGQSYSLAVSGVGDASAAHNTLTTNAQFTAWVYCRGFVHADVYSGIGGAALSDLTNNAAFPHGYSSSTDLGAFERGDFADNYGQRLRAWLLPPTTGYYTFYVASDDQGALALSSDEASVNAAPIAFVPGASGWRNYTANASQRSAAVWLVAGRSYYIEALQKEGGGGDYVNVAWQRPGESAPAAGAPPIPAAYLATAANPAGVSLTVTDPTNVVVAESMPATFAVTVTTSASLVFYQWQRNGEDIPGANAATYTTPRLLRTETGASYACYVSVPGAHLTSGAAGVTVTPDTVAPRAISAATLAGSGEVGVCFDERMDAKAASDPANYALSIGGRVVSATLRPDGQSVLLKVTALGFTNHNLTLGNLKDYAGNPLAPNTTIPVAAIPLERTDLGAAGDPVEPGSTFTCQAGRFDCVAGGGDFWGSSDRGHFVYQRVEGDFDVAVRLESYEGGNTYSRAGLMARAGLEANSVMVNVTLFPTTGANRYEAHYRSAPSAGVGGWPGANQYAFPNVGVPLPNAWVRLTRTNDTFTAFASQDATNWTQFSQFTFAMTNRLFVGMASSAQNNAAGVVTRIGYRDYRAPSPAFGPAPLDLAIKRSSDPVAAYALDNVYLNAPAGAQILDQPADVAQPASFAIRVQNDGAAAQNVVVTAVESAGSGWTVRYRVGGDDVTAAIVSANGYPIAALAPGSPVDLQVDVAPGDRVLGAARKSATLRVSTEAWTGGVRDAVFAEAINKVGHQPDLMVRRMSDVLYVGEGIYNLDGVGQTKAIRLNGCGEAMYAFRLLNAGNLTNTFVLTAASVGAGWDARYYEGLTGAADITSGVTGGGIHVTLSPGASWEGRAMPVPGPGAASGSTNLIKITARSAANAARADAVGLATTIPAPTAVPQAAVYDTDADFEQGELIGTAYGNNELTLSEQSVTRPYIWVPNSNEGTVSRVDTRTGNEVGRYRVCPPGVTGNPSRTTIDQYGNCWVANRQSATAVKIGLIDEGEFIDRNGNGVADTSADTDLDGNIAGVELLAWGQDECVLYEVVLIPGREGTFAPGTYTAGYANDYWNPGPRGVAIDFDGNLWCGAWGTMKYYYIDGRTAQILAVKDVSTPVAHHPYGALIDSYGNLWSSGYNDTLSLNNLLFFDPVSDWTTNFNLGHRVYGLGIDRADHLFVAGYDSSVLTRLNVVTFNRDWTVSAPYQTRGVAVTDDGDVWTANSSPGTVTRSSNDGVFKATIAVGSGPTGVSVDADGKVWAVNQGDEYIKRIDPKTDTIDLAKRVIGGLHYGYSDMTGVIARNTTARFGTWTVTHDARVELTQWGTVAWQANDPAGNGVRVRVRSANRCGAWSAWEYAANGVPLAATPPGRYLQVEVALTCPVGSAAPVLDRLTVDPLPQRNTDLAVSLDAPTGPLTNDHLVTWNIVGLNRGPADARGVILSNWFQGINLLSVTQSMGTLVQTSGGIRCDVGDLKAGSNFTLTVMGELNATGTVTNTAGLSHYERDTAPANNLATVRALVLPNPCVAPPEGLVAWWPGDGDAADVRGGINGTLVNGATFAAGKVGQGFSLNGANAYVEFGRVSPGTRWSLEAWVKLSSVGSGRRVVVGCHADCRDWSLLSNEGQWGVNIGRGSCVAIVGSGVFAVPGVWYHLVGTCDGTNATIYVNGEPRNTEPVSLNFVGSSSSLRIGSSVCCGEYLAGCVDEVALYNRPLTDAEVFALYDSLRSGKCRAAFTPALAIGVVSDAEAAVSWPSAAIGFQLQSAPTVNGIWQLETGSPQAVGDQLVLPVTTTDGARFYRLRKP